MTDSFRFGDFEKYLSERERLLLDLRYKQGLSLRETGETMGLSHERIRQLQHKLVSGMMRTMLAMDGRIRQLSENRDYWRERCEEAEKTVEVFRRREREPEAEIPGTERRSADTLSEDGIELLNLSVRSYNCLLRAGMPRIRDILETEPEDLIGIRNFGAVSQREVIAAMRKLGFASWARKQEEHIFGKTNDESGNGDKT